MIPCPTCNGKSGVKETRSRDGLRRRRKCHDCGTSFWSVEITATEYDRLKSLEAGLAELSAKFPTTKGKPDVPVLQAPAP